MPVKTILPAKSKFSSTRIAVFVPSTSGINKKISKKAFRMRLRNTAKFMTKKFGGSTRIRAKGTFVSEMKSGKVVTENIGIVEAFIPKSSMNMKSKDDINSFLRTKKTEWGQESLAVQVESPQKKATTVHFV